MKNVKTRTASALLCAICWFSAPSIAQEPLKIRIGNEPSYPPFVITKPDGTMSGLEIDLVKEVCARAKADCTYKSMDFSGLLPAIITGKVDLIAENLLQTPERKAKALLTREVVYNPSVLAVPASWSTGFSSGDLSGKRIGVYKGSGQLVMVTDVIKTAVPVTYESIDQMAIDIQAGRIDAILLGKLDLTQKFMDGPNAGKYKLSDREFFAPGLESKGSVWVIRKGEERTLDAVNSALNSMIADCTYTKIRKKYTNIVMVRDEPARCQ
ncbi:substrate-binding periplasmic protein [Paraburkholderia sp. MM6662-R1]|uniref:substrate-binding periplasmic protein n=1 Tax=Paraburkholderia sp. MM6662-R1 TaxID=2991066 RepID=UPI003D1D8012